MNGARLHHVRSASERSTIRLLWPVGVAVYLLMALALYGRVIGYPFSPLDDYAYVTDNPVIQSLAIQNLAQMFLLKFSGNFAPLHILAYALEYRAWGLWAPGYHAVNVLLHGVNAGLVAMLCLRLGASPAAGFMSGLLFLIHPVQVESIAWVSELKTPLAAMFFLASFLLYIRGRCRGGRWPIVVSVVLFAAANFSKPSAIAFPLLLILYNRMVHADDVLRSIRRATPFILISLLTALMAVNTQTGGAWGGLAWQGRLSSVWSMTGLIVTEYFQHLLFPVRLSPYYYIVPEEVPVFLKIGGGCLLLGLLILVVRQIKARRLSGLLGAWFFIMLLPNANILPLETLIADRYLYLPCIGPILLFVMAVEGLLHARRGSLRAWVAGGMIAVGATALVLLTVDQSSLWKDKITFYRSIARDNPAPRILTPLVEYYAASESPDDRLLVEETGRQAVEAIRRELTRRPKDNELYEQLGVVYEKTGRWGEAKAALDEALALNPSYPEALERLAGIALWIDKDYRKALEITQRNIQIAPRRLFPHIQFVQALSALGMMDAAKQGAEEIIRLWPGDPVGVALLADLCRNTGETERAVSLYRKVMAMNPDSQIARDASRMIQDLGRTP